MLTSDLDVIFIAANTFKLFLLTTTAPYSVTTYKKSKSFKTITVLNQQSSLTVINNLFITQSMNLQLDFDFYDNGLTHSLTDTEKPTLINTCEVKNMFSSHLIITTSEM